MSCTKDDRFTKTGSGQTYRREGNALNKREAVFSQPTVEGVDFPTLGISAARNDLSTGELLVKTYAAAPSCAGQATSFKLTTLDGCDLASLTQGGR